MSYISYSKSFQGVADVFLRKPDRYAPLLQFIETVMVGPSALTQAEDEVFHLAHQDRSTWTFDLTIRPFAEKW